MIEEYGPGGWIADHPTGNVRVRIEDGVRTVFDEAGEVVSVEQVDMPDPVESAVDPLDARLADLEAVIDALLGED